MKEIQLTQGKVALVDDEDYDWINGFKWHYTHFGYAGHRTDIKTIVLMHRLILCAPKGMEVDHKNRDKLDNRRDNIRLCTRGQNNANRGVSRGSSKYKGVFWETRSKRWRAEAAKDKVVYTVGRFRDEKEAALAYNKKTLELWGEYARTNVI